MNDRLEELGLTLKGLERLTGDSYKNLGNWLRGSTKVPAHFTARYIEAVPVNPTWLLTGNGQREPIESETALKLYGLIESVVAVTDTSLPPGQLNALLDQVTAILRASLDGSGEGGGE